MNTNKIGFSGIYYGEFNCLSKARQFETELREISLNRRIPVKTIIRQYGPITKLKIETPHKQNDMNDKRLIARTIHNLTSTANILFLQKKQVAEYFDKFMQNVL